MNENRTTHRSGRTAVRLAVVLCLMLVVSLLPLAAYGVVAPVTHADVQVSYLDSAAISLDATGAAHTYLSLDGAPAVESLSCTTSVYGSHVLKFWSVDAGGVSEATITAPFFVDDDIHPTIVSDATGSYVLAASITATATDNFNGSGIDFLCYRVDGKNYVQVSPPSASAAARLFFARLAAISGTAASFGPPDLPNYDNPPVPHYGTNCAGCHALIQDGGETGPGGTFSKSITVTGIGTHTVEFWTQDVARNESAHVTSTFTISKVATSLTIARSKSSIYRYHYVTISGKLAGGVPAGAPVVLQIKSPGSSSYRTLSTRTTAADGSWSYRVKLSKRGRCYFRARYAGTADYASCSSRSIYVTVK